MVYSSDALVICLLCVGRVGGFMAMCRYGCVLLMKWSCLGDGDLLVMRE